MISYTSIIFAILVLLACIFDRL